MTNDHVILEFGKGKTVHSQIYRLDFRKANSYKFKVMLGNIDGQKY